MQQKADIIPFTPHESYADILSKQEKHVEHMLCYKGAEAIFYGEHAPVYTCGTSGKETDVTGNFPEIPLIHTGRGGELTYHGPGQLVIYPLLDLRERGRDLRSYVNHLQKAIIDTLTEYDIKAYTNDDIGVWVKTGTGEEKIAAIGIRIRKWITFHGIALNINPELSHFQGIIPCGIHDRGVTSMAKCGVIPERERLAQHLIARILDFQIS